MRRIISPASAADERPPAAIPLVLYSLFLYYVVFEGALRKWVLPSATNALFLLKDVILFAALFALWFAEGRRMSRYYPYNAVETVVWQTWLAISLGGLVLAEFSLSGLAGFRYYVAALPILLLQPLLTPTTEQIGEFFERFLIVALGVCLLGFVQFISPYDAVINAYAWSPTSDMDVATFGEVSERGGSPVVRITGTFSYIAPYGAYLVFMVFCCIALFLLARSDRRRIFYGFALLLLVANMLMTGSRGPVLVVMLLSIFFWRDFATALARQSLSLNVALGVLTLSLGAWVISDLFAALSARNEMAQDSSERIVGALFTPIYTLFLSPWIGEGVGATFSGMRQLTGTGLNEMRFDELFQDRLGVDLGVFGYLFFLSVKMYFLVATFILVRRARSAEVRVWALVSFSYQASLIWTIPLYNAVSNIFYFVCIAMYVILRRENNAANQMLAARRSARARMR